MSCRLRTMSRPLSSPAPPYFCPSRPKHQDGIPAERLGVHVLHPTSSRRLGRRITQDRQATGDKLGCHRHDHPVDERSLPLLLLLLLGPQGSEALTDNVGATFDHD